VWERKGMKREGEREERRGREREREKRACIHPPVWPFPKVFSNRYGPTY